MYSCTSKFILVVKGIINPCARNCIVVNVNLFSWQECFLMIWTIFIWNEIYSCDGILFPVLVNYSSDGKCISVTGYFQDLFLREFQQRLCVRSYNFVSTWLPGWPWLSQPGWGCEQFVLDKIWIGHPWTPHNFELCHVLE